MKNEEMMMEAGRNSMRYEPRYRGCSQQAFMEGAVWMATQMKEYIKDYMHKEEKK